MLFSLLFWQSRCEVDQRVHLFIFNHVLVLFELGNSHKNKSWFEKTWLAEQSAMCILGFGSRQGDWLGTNLGPPNLYCLCFKQCFCDGWEMNVSSAWFTHIHTENMKKLPHNVFQNWFPSKGQSEHLQSTKHSNLVSLGMCEENCGTSDNKANKGSGWTWWKHVNPEDILKVGNIDATVKSHV